MVEILAEVHVEGPPPDKPVQPCPFAEPEEVAP